MKVSKLKIGVTIEVRGVHGQWCWLCPFLRETHGEVHCEGDFSSSASRGPYIRLKTTDSGWPIRRRECIAATIKETGDDQS